jgi:transcriptional regulator with XRE-family HTH domain
MGPAIRVLRERRGLRQREAAAMRGTFDQSRWSKVERGVQSPSLEVLDTFLETLDADLYDLMDALLGEDPPPQDITRHVLTAYRLGDLTDSEEDVLLQLIHDHRETLQRVVAEFRRRREGAGAEE